MGVRGRERDSERVREKSETRGRGRSEGEREERERKKTYSQIQLEWRASAEGEQGVESRTNVWDSLEYKMVQAPWKVSLVPTKIQKCISELKEIDKLLMIR